MGGQIGMVWKLATGDLTPEERAVAVKLVAKYGWRLVVGLHILTACGGLAVLGVSGFARAGDIDNKIAAQTKPLVEQIDKQSKVIEAIGRQVNDQVANSLASEIRYLVSKKCAEKNPVEKDRWQREIDRKQYEYRDIRKEFYQFGCDDV